MTPWREWNGRGGNLTGPPMGNKAVVWWGGRPYTQSPGGWWTLASENTNTAAWRCSCCGAENKAKGKACGTCRAVRTYAEAAGAGAGEPPTQGTSSWRQGWKQRQDSGNGGGAPTLPPVHLQLKQVTDALQAITVEDGTVGKCPEPKIDEVVDVTEDDVSLSVLQARLKTLESMLASIPKDEGGDAFLAEQRKSLQAQVDQTKLAMAEQKPIGQRLDAARELLKRARGRAQRAEEAVKVAQQAAAHYQHEVEEWEVKVAQLESLVPRAPPPPVQNPFDQLRTSLHSIATEMGRHASVQQELQPVTQAMEGLWGMLEAVRQQAAAVEGGQAQCSLLSSALPPLQLKPRPPVDRSQQNRLMDMLGAVESFPDVEMPADASLVPTPAASLGGGPNPAAVGGG